MSWHQHFRFRYSFVALTLTVFALPLTTASADTVWYKSAGAKKALKYENVKVLKVDAGNLVFDSSSGNETRKALADVSRIAMDDEPALTAAEEAYDGGNFPGAIDGYRKAATASARPWVKQRAALRLIDAGNKASDFGAAVAGFAALATIDADAAGKVKPTIPPGAPKSTLTGAIRDIQNAAGSTGIKPEQLRVLLNFEIELQTAAHDTDGASATLKQLAKVGGGTPPADGGPGAAPVDSSAVVRARAEEKINSARVALAQKDYKHASEILAVAGDGIVAPDQQDEAMFMIAEAKAGLAGDDPKGLMDAGIAYMRVVANFGKLQGAAHIAESLMKTAAIEEKLSKREEALRIYNEVASVYKGTPPAQDAADSAARISAALKPKG